MTGMVRYDKPGGWPTVHWWDGPGEGLTACGESIVGMRMHAWPNRIVLGREVRCRECMAWKALSGEPAE